MNLADIGVVALVFVAGIVADRLWIWLWTEEPRDPWEWPR